MTIWQNDVSLNGFWPTIVDKGPTIIGIYWDHLLVSDPGAKCKVKGIENDVRW